MRHLAERPCACGCSERGTGPPDEYQRIDAVITEREAEWMRARDERAYLEQIAAQPPWTNGYYATFEQQYHAGEVHLVLTWGLTPEYGPTSPRTGEPCPGARAWEEWHESTASGGLWDHAEEARARGRTSGPWRVGQGRLQLGGDQRDVGLLRVRLGLGREPSVVLRPVRPVRAKARLGKSRATGAARCRWTPQGVGG